MQNTRPLHLRETDPHRAQRRPLPCLLQEDYSDGIRTDLEGNKEMYGIANTLLFIYFLCIGDWLMTKQEKNEETKAHRSSFKTEDKFNYFGLPTDSLSYFLIIALVTYPMHT